MAATSSLISHDSPVLVINSGSSSLKFGLYRTKDRDEELVLNGSAENIARPDGRLSVKDGSGNTLVNEKRDFASSRQALEAVSNRLKDSSNSSPVAVGHRIVHGGPKLRSHQRITPSVIRTLEDSVHFAPLHIPPALTLIREVASFYPGTPQFACFDTAFHATLPEAAAHFALPAELWNAGILRYGFHGLSYESIVSILGTELRPRTVVAHLGNGCSLAALSNGISVDTSMGLTPTGGIPMSSRSGDLDPGVILYLLRVRKLDAGQLEVLLNEHSGLAGIAGGESDLRNLQAAAAKGDEKAALAIEIFCRAIRKTIGSYAAVLGGIDLLVFTGGIGENSVIVRGLVLARLGFLGLAEDPAANAGHGRSAGGRISRPGPVQALVVPTDEELMIARDTVRLIAVRPGGRPRF